MTETAGKKALLIAYHYPPVRISSGVQRTLSFSQDLPTYGWDPLVLSIKPSAYESTSDGQLKDIPDGLPVVRAWGLDTARHLAFKGRYLDSMALPDRWASWWIGGVLSGLRMIRRHKPKVLFSTYPIATAHLIGLTLHKLTGLPWIADFRDSMTENGYPREGRRRRVFLWIERKTVQACSRAIFTTPGAVRMYRDRYPEIPDSRWAMIPNGYNEDIFRDVENEISSEERQAQASRNPLLLVHSGVLYPSERDPRAFFQALGELKRSGDISAETLRIRLRATGHNQIFAPMLEEHDIADIVELPPGVDYRMALREMLQADGLLLFQASNCNHQIPAKLYEYFRARRPLLGLTDITGDTAHAMQDAGLTNIVALDDSEEIRTGLISFLAEIKSGSAAVVSHEKGMSYSRQSAAEVLAGIFEDCQGVL